MSKLKKRPSRFASATNWLAFDASELSWILVAVGGVLFFAYMTGG